MRNKFGVYHERKKNTIFGRAEGVLVFGPAAQIVAKKMSITGSGILMFIRHHQLVHVPGNVSSGTTTSVFSTCKSRTGRY
jgi:hypothetical protein